MANKTSEARDLATKANYFAAAVQGEVTSTLVAEGNTLLGLTYKDRANVSSA